MIKRVLLLGFVGVGIYGGYYGYCRYQVGEKAHLFDQQMQDLQQQLLRLDKTITPADIRRVVLEVATRADVQVQAKEVRVTIEPLNAASLQKLPSIARTGIGIVAGIPRYQGPRWVVGYQVRLRARYGAATTQWVAERYTWFDDAKP